MHYADLVSSIVGSV